jgi:hypothetical protein
MHAKGLEVGLLCRAENLGRPSLSSDTGLFHSEWKRADLSLVYVHDPHLNVKWLTF